MGTSQKRVWQHFQIWNEMITPLISCDSVNIRSNPLSFSILDLPGVLDLMFLQLLKSTLL